VALCSVSPLRRRRCRESNSCGHVFAEEGVFRNGHLLSCEHNHSYNMTLRHHDTVRAIQRVLAKFQIPSNFNPTYLSPTLIPDLH